MAQLKLKQDLFFFMIIKGRRLTLGAVSATSFNLLKPLLTAVTAFTSDFFAL